MLYCMCVIVKCQALLRRLYNSAYSVSYETERWWLYLRTHQSNDRDIQWTVSDLLASLPDSYNMLVMVLEANTDVPNMEVLTKKLLHEGQKLKDQAGTGVSSEEQWSSFNEQGRRVQDVITTISLAISNGAVLKRSLTQARWRKEPILCPNAASQRYPTISANVPILSSSVSLCSIPMLPHTVSECKNVAIFCILKSTNVQCYPLQCPNIISQCYLILCPYVTYQCLG